MLINENLSQFKRGEDIKKSLRVGSYDPGEIRKKIDSIKEILEDLEISVEYYSGHENEGLFMLGIGNNPGQIWLLGYQDSGLAIAPYNEMRGEDGWFFQKEDSEPIIEGSRNPLEVLQAYFKNDPDWSNIERMIDSVEGELERLNTIKKIIEM